MAIKTHIQLPPDDELRNAHPGVWSWYDTCFPDPEHPIESRLSLALVRRLSHLWAPPEWNSSRIPEGALPLLALLAKTTRPYWVAHKEEFRQICKEVRDLLSRLHPLPLEPADETLLRHTSEAFRKHNLLVEEIEELQRELTKARKGPKPTKRLIAVKALDLLEHHPGYSWEDLARRFCQCDKRMGHDFHCRENMRLAVDELNKALERYGV